MSTDPGPASYGTCRVCGDAVPPDAARCPICGAEDPIRAGQSRALPPASRRRFLALRTARAAVVLAVVAGLVLLLVQAAFTPPPVAADPLTETQTMRIDPGNRSLISGDITGGDYIQGNFTVLDPPGAELTLLVFNATEYAQYSAGRPALTQENYAPGSAIRIVFDALYTDTYYFVFQNQYPVGSGLTLTVYVTTTYETSVVLA